MIDYTAVVADLETKRAALDQVLDGFLKLAGGATGNPKAPGARR